MDFTNPQKEAIEHIYGPCLVLAGPGSGKTAVLTRRIRKLVSSNIAPESILVITFTKASALEMQERFNGLMDKKCPVNFGTFHSCFYGILRQEMQLNSNSIVVGYRKLELLKEVVSSTKMSPDGEDYFDNLSKEFSYIKNVGVDINSYSSDYFSKEELIAAFNKYEAIKNKYGLIDFDDMLSKTYELFISDKEALKRWQNQFKFILIDEAQDMNDLQYKIVKLLAGRDKNVFIVGDDDQSIYGFRGANPKIMQRFKQEFLGCKTIVLNTNFRCPSNIVKMAKSLISNNEMRFDKDINASKPSGICEILVGEDKSNHSKMITKKIKELIAENNSYRDIAIIFRNNLQGQCLISELINEKIPFYIKDNMPNIYNHFIFLDIESYFNLATSKATRTDLLRIINRPNRYIQRAALDFDCATLEKCKLYYKGTDFMEQRVEALICDINLVKKLTPYAAANYIKKAMGYERFVNEEALRLGQNLDDIKEVFDLLDDILKSEKTLDKALEKIYMLRQELDLKNSSKSRVRGNQVGLYTLHGSKGLEFKICFIIDVNEGIIPSRKARNPAELEEERRMFYVGLTRAKEQLYLCYAKKKNQEALSPSRFISELGLEDYSSSSSS